MTDDEPRARIVIDPGIMVGQPCSQGSRLPARLIVSMLTHGATSDGRYKAYPHLTSDDAATDTLSVPWSANSQPHRP
jgi:uncharacterized protein (DUF433 family)